jgi:hypothetical protein
MSKEEKASLFSNSQYYRKGIKYGKEPWKMTEILIKEMKEWFIQLLCRCILEHEREG